MTIIYSWMKSNSIHEKINNKFFNCYFHIQSDKSFLNGCRKEIDELKTRRNISPDNLELGLVCVRNKILEHGKEKYGWKLTLNK